MKKKMMIKVAQLMLLMVVVLVVVAQTHSSALTQDDEAASLELPSQAGGYEVERPWPCCDTCVCTRSIPPQCQCMDQMQGGCHPKCKKCEQLPLRIFPPLFVCNDVSDKCAEPCHKDHAQRRQQQLGFHGWTMY